MEPMEIDDRKAEITSLPELKAAVLELMSQEDIPAIPGGLSVEKLKILLKAMPKVPAWHRTMLNRHNFFEIIISDIDTVIGLIDRESKLKAKLKILENTFETNLQNMSIADLELYRNLKSKDTLSALTLKIKSMIDNLKTFTILYKNSKILKYKNNTLPQPSSIANDIMKSEYTKFMENLENQYKVALKDSITKMQSS